MNKLKIVEPKEFFLIYPITGGFKFIVKTKDGEATSVMVKSLQDIIDIMQMSVDEEDMKIGLNS